MEWIKYEDQLQFGILFARHRHFRDDYNKKNNKYHYHVFIDIGKYCLEITIGEKYE